MPTWRSALAALVALLACAACAPVGGRFAADAYYEQAFPLRATYANAATRQIPPGDWVLMNYQFKNGVPSEPKVTGDIVYGFDTNGDGSLDTKETVKEFSLLYRHATTGANIWFFIEPLSEENARLDLSVIANNHVEASSGSGTVAVSIAPGVAIAATRKYATRVLDGRAATIGGFPSYVVTYEIANVDQLGLSPNSRWRRARVAFIRTPYRWVLRSAKTYVARWPAIAVIGYDAEPADFDAHLSEFAGFAANLEFMGDMRVLALHAEDLVKCANGQAANLSVHVEPDGTVGAAALDTSPSDCARRALSDARFAPSGDAERGIDAKVPVVAAPPVATTAPELIAPVPSTAAGTP